MAVDDDVTRRALQTVLRRRRAQVDPSRYELKRSDPRGRRAGGLGLTQAQVDGILKLRKDTYHCLENEGRLPAKNPEEILEGVVDLFCLPKHEQLWLWKVLLHRDPEETAGEQVPGAWRRKILSSPHIAYLTNHRWDILLANEETARALPSGKAPQNSVEWTLTALEARDVLGDWDASWARQIVPLLWAARWAYRDDRVLAEMEAKVQADSRCGPIYEEFGPVYAHPDGAVRPFVHAELGPGWVTICASIPEGAPTCRAVEMIFQPGKRRPSYLPPIPATPA